MRTNDEVVKDIQRILDESILPHVQSHGGHVSLQKYEDGVATMFLTGACSGCAMSSATLKMGIENMLKHYVAEGGAGGRGRAAPPGPPPEGC